MSFDEYLYFIALIGCLVLFYFRGRLQNQSIRTKTLSVLSMVIISIVPIVNIVAFVVILFDWFFADSFPV
mgnify:CR=1 FL=1